MIRKIQIFCLFFLLLFTMGIVSANEDVNLTDTFSNDGPILETSDVDMYYKDGTSFNVKLLNNNNGVVGEKINLTINGVTYGRTTNSSGMAKLNLNLAPGEYEVKTDSILDNQKLSVINTIKIKEMNTSIVADKVVDIGFKDGAYSIYLIGGNNKPLADKAIYFNIHGVDYKRTTNSEGFAKININLDPGTYLITTHFSENFYASARLSSAINVGIYETRFESKYVNFKSNDVVYEVKLLDIRDNPVKDHNVVFVVNGENIYTKTNQNGIATLSKVFNPGEHNISFKFSGTTGYLKSQGSNKINVSSSTVDIRVNDYETYIDSPLPYLVSLNSNSGVGLVNLTLITEFYKDEKLVKTMESKTYEDGVARLKLDLEAGNYTVKNHLTSEKNVVTTKLIIKPASMKVDAPDLLFNQIGQYFIITVKNNETGCPLEGKSVIMVVNGVPYKRTTNKNGEAKLQINLNNGNYEINYFVNGSGRYGDVYGDSIVEITSSKVSSNLEFLNSEITRGGSYCYVKLNDVNNRPLAGKVIYITINGVDYKRTTDSEGLAKIKINLPDNDYVFNVNFYGDDGYLSSFKYANVRVNTIPDFNYTLKFNATLTHNGFSCPIIYQIDVDYGAAKYQFGYCDDEGRPELSKNSYFISNDGLESVYTDKSGIELRAIDGMIYLTFYGKAADLSQFSVIFSIDGESRIIKFVLDNEVIATARVAIFYDVDNFYKLLDLGYTFMGTSYAQSVMKHSGKVFERSVVIGTTSLPKLKNTPTFDNFDTIQSYLMTSIKITDEILQNEVNKAINFKGDYEKYAYELYLASLMTIWASDSCSNEAAKELGITWEKASQIVLADFDWSGINFDGYYLFSVNGDEDKSKLFKLYYGILFSSCEGFGLESTGNPVSSVVNDIMNGINEGNGFVIDQREDIIHLRLVNSSDSIDIDLKTGYTNVTKHIDTAFIASQLTLKGAGYIGFSSYDIACEYGLGTAINAIKRNINDLFGIFSSINPRVIYYFAAKDSSTILTTGLQFTIGKLNHVGILFIGVSFQQLTLEYKNHFASENKAQYFSAHESIYQVKTIAVVNPATGYMDYVEIPYDDFVENKLNMDDARYIDSVNGRRNLTDFEKDYYRDYDVFAKV